MNPITEINNIPCEFKHLNNNQCAITFTLDSNIIPAFVALMQSLASLFTGLAWKQKTNLEQVRQRIKESEPERESYRQEYENTVCAIFNNYIEKGENPRVSLSLTISSVHSQYPNSSYDNVKNCLTKNKLLKKTGFYKQKR